MAKTMGDYPKPDSCRNLVAIALRKAYEQKFGNPSEFIDALQQEGLEFNRTTVFRWFKGERLPGLENIRVIAKVLGVQSTDDLLPLPPKKMVRSDNEKKREKSRN